MKKSIYILLLVLLFSCKKEEPNLIGSYHNLEEDNINIFLPEGFEYKTIEQIKESHKRVKNDEERFYYEKALEEQQSLKGNFYTYFNTNTFSEFFIKTIPYMSFNKNDAKGLMYTIREDQEKYRKISGIQHDKIGATYFGDKNFQVFKGRYELSRYNSYDDKDEDFKMFKTIYLITSNKKTFLLNILTPVEVDYDPFIRKFKL